MDDQEILAVRLRLMAVEQILDSLLLREGIQLDTIQNWQTARRTSDDQAALMNAAIEICRQLKGQ